MTQITYGELLKDPRWQRLRLKVMERDGFRCLGCGSERHTLHVHHYTYKFGKNPWEYPMDNFATLCEGCHDLETELRNSRYLKNISIKAKTPAVKLWYLITVVAFAKVSHVEIYEELRSIMNQKIVHLPDRNKALIEFLTREVDG